MLFIYRLKSLYYILRPLCRFSFHSFLLLFAFQLMVICSWTKLWACPGLRLGSIACGPKWYTTFKKLQTPWSCSSLAQAFCAAAAADNAYMERTWETIPAWKSRHEALIQKLGWSINENCPPWVPYIFLDCLSAEVGLLTSLHALRTV